MSRRDPVRKAASSPGRLFDPLLTAKQAAERLGISLRTMRALIASRALPVVRLSPRSLRIHPEDLERFVDERRA